MPRIRYCPTPAGRVAYSTAGAGPPLLCDTGWITDLRRQHELFSLGSFVERLAERFTVIRYDKPGCGLAPADVRDSVVALVRAHWGLGLKALAGAFVSNPTAEEIEAFARFQRASASAEVAARLLEVCYSRCRARATCSTTVTGNRSWTRCSASCGSRPGRRHRSRPVSSRWPAWWPGA